MKEKMLHHVSLGALQGAQRKVVQHVFLQQQHQHLRQPRLSQQLNQQSQAKNGRIKHAVKH